MRKLLAILLPFALMLTACGGSDSSTSGKESALESVKVTSWDKDKAPKVEFDKPLTVSEPSVKTLAEGTGQAIKPGQILKYNAALFNAQDGQSTGDTYSQGTQQSMTVDDALKAQVPAVYDALIHSKVGAELAYMEPAAEAPAGSTSSPQPASLLVMRVESAKDAPKLMGQSEVKKLDEAGALPTVTRNAKNVPTIKIPAKKDAPSDLVVKVLKEGTGAKVTSSSTVTAHYAGVRWEDGKVFDSSYSRGETADFPLNQVIKGWTLGLAGQRVGSSVMLVIPAELAYGDPVQQQGAPSGPLVFVVDIKGAK
ncbi:FKBP-type peptidyl-prolyl cis-trans isomerase [Arthrobacter sp. GCM10027362]|uniref:FKBP-type peptidyl-prolyl cis-trans isomerase n=1 Tax=Arthrobacter sp. GCM10027362 TaxID=3273379 RepID=UPI003632B35E